MYTAILVSCILVRCLGDKTIDIQTMFGKTDKTAISLDKRSDGLMAELVHLLVNQSHERKSILERCKLAEKLVYKLTKDFDVTKQSLNRLEKRTTKQQIGTTKQMKDTKTTVNDLEKLVRKQSHQIVMMQNKIHKLQKITGSFRKMNGIGFSVRFRPNSYTFSFGGIVKFNYIISNNGNSYSTTTGKFTCTKPGLYTFYLTVISNSNWASAWIVKNKSLVVEAFASGGKHSNSQKRYESGSTSTVLRLKAGDEIWVKVGNVKYSVFEWNSSFSGIYISE